MIGSTVLKECVVIYAVVLLITCVYNFVVSPLVFCRLEHNCSGVTVVTVQGMYSRTTATACFVSTVALLRSYWPAMAVYAKNVRAYEVYVPTAVAELRGRALLDAVYVVACLLIIVPVNVARLVLAYQDLNRDLFVITFMVFLYTGNVTMCLVETRFVALCRHLTAMFADVNRDLRRLADEMAAPGPAVAAATAYRADFYRPGAGASYAANAAEVLRIRHRLTCDAMHVLNDLYGVPMGSSLFSLGVMSLFDIYYEVYDFAGAETRVPAFIYMWLLQYSLRFYMIVKTAHGTTKEALKSKTLITDINNRHLDNATRDELLLFLNQISCCTIEFTAYDFFTLNTHLITSSIGAGITFLVILLQFDL